MLKLLQLSIIFMLITFTACTDKVPFTPKKSSQNSALVYIYVPNEITASNNVDSTISYKLKIGGEPIQGYISDGSYMVFRMKPSNVTFHARKNSLFKHNVTVDVKKGRTYFLKISKLEDSDDFSFSQVKESLGEKEIVSTGLANSVKIDKKMINTNILRKTPTPTTATFSKTVEIQKAYELKEKGIVTAKEFNQLKQEILSK